MNGFILSIAAVAVLTGSLIYMKENSIKTVNEYKQSKSIVAYVQKAKALNTLSSADINANPSVLMIGSSKNKSIEKRLAEAMRAALKTTQNPTCEDLSKTGYITYGECLTETKRNDPFVKLQNGVVILPNNTRQINNMVKAQLSVNGYYLKQNLQTSQKNIKPALLVADNNVNTITKLNRKQAREDYVQAKINSTGMSSAIKNQFSDKIKKVQEQIR